MRNLLVGFAGFAVGVSSILLFAASANAAGSYTLFGDASTVFSGGNPGAYIQATSDSTSPGYGGIDFALPGTTTVNDLNTLATDYKVVAGDCGGGAPRFSVTLSTGKSIFVYLGPTPNFKSCGSGWQSTGNLLSDVDLRVDTTQVGGTFYDTWAHAKTLVGSDVITDLALVVDGSWAVGGDQSFGFDNTNINGTVYTYEPPTYTVTIDKYLNGKMATAASANNSAFPMVSSWDAVNLGGSGSGSYTLSPTGFNSPNAYEAVTSPMNEGSSYTTHEVTGGSSIVGASCSARTKYMLVGYSVGSSMAAAAAAPVHATIPDFANLSQNEYVIVWNETCASVTNSNTASVTVTTTSISSTGGNHATGGTGGNGGTGGSARDYRGGGNTVTGGRGGNGGSSDNSGGAVISGAANSRSGSFVIVNTNFTRIR